MLRHPPYPVIAWQQDTEKAEDIALKMDDMQYNSKESL